MCLSPKDTALVRQHVRRRSCLLNGNWPDNTGSSVRSSEHFNMEFSFGEDFEGEEIENAEQKNN